MENYFRCGFCLSEIQTAQIVGVRDDRVKFSLINQFGEKYVGWYYVKCAPHCNPHKVFHQGETIPVRIVNLYKRRHRDVQVEVRPTSLPIDDFIADHELDEVVNGTVYAEKKDGLVICLGKNVFALAKKTKFFKTGTSILCRLKKYDETKKLLYVSILTSIAV